MPGKKRKLNYRSEKFSMLPSYFDYIFVHLGQKVRLRPQLSSKFLSNLGPNPTYKTRPDLQLWSTLSKQKNNKPLIFF